MAGGGGGGSALPSLGGIDPLAIRDASGDGEDAAGVGAMDDIPIEEDIGGLPVTRLQAVLSATQAEVAGLEAAVALAEGTLAQARQEVASEAPLCHKRPHATATSPYVPLSAVETAEEPQFASLDAIPTTATTVGDEATAQAPDGPLTEYVIAHSAHVASAVLVGAVVGTPTPVDGTDGAETLLRLAVHDGLGGGGTAEYEVRCVGPVFGRYCAAVVRPGCLLHAVGTLRPRVAQAAGVLGVEVVVEEMGGVLQVIYADAASAPQAAEPGVASDAQ
jgi:hypothetical protein